MNATRYLTPALMIAATLAAAFSVQAPRAAEPAQRVVTLPLVEVVGKRENLLEPRVVQLPRVTVIGKRPVTGKATRLAQESAAPAPRS